MVYVGASLYVQVVNCCNDLHGVLLEEVYWQVVYDSLLDRPADDGSDCRDEFLLVTVRGLGWLDGLFVDYPISV